MWFPSSRDLRRRGPSMTEPSIRSARAECLAHIAQTADVSTAPPLPIALIPRPRAPLNAAGVKSCTFGAQAVEIARAPVDFARRPDMANGVRFLRIRLRRPSRSEQDASARQNARRGVSR